MSPTADNKKYATDTRLFGDAVRQDGIHLNFEDSPVSRRMTIKDVCIYRPGDLNKIGKEGKTSWDSFSYALMMAHNVWMHIEAVQRANQQYDQGVKPAMLVHPLNPQHDAEAVIDQVFAARDRQRSLAIIESNSKVWERIIGTRGFTGKRAINAHSQFNSLFDFDDDESTGDEELDSDKLDALELSNDNR
jgi:hypothetical protein